MNPSRRRRGTLDHHDRARAEEELLAEHDQQHGGGQAGAVGKMRELRRRLGPRPSFGSASQRAPGTRHVPALPGASDRYHGGRVRG